MQWITPKTDWQIRKDADGKYIGDYFETGDYNRIKNNLQFLREFALRLYPAFEIADMGEDRCEEDYLYADEVNLLEKNLERIAAGTFHPDYGEAPVFADNEAYINYVELNRIEGAMLNLYKNLTGQYEGRRMLTFMLGSREVL